APELAQGVLGRATPMKTLRLYGLLLTACTSSAYTPGKLTDPPPGLDVAYANGRRVSACLDLGAWTIPPAEGGSASEVELQVDTGNRCDRILRVDLTRLGVTATCGGAPLPLSPADPDDSPPARLLAPHASASVRVLYTMRGGVPICADGPPHVCVDV